MSTTRSVPWDLVIVISVMALLLRHEVREAVLPGTGSAPSAIAQMDLGRVVESIEGDIGSAVGVLLVLIVVALMLARPRLG